MGCVAVSCENKTVCAKGAGHESCSIAYAKVNRKKLKVIIKFYLSGRTIHTNWSMFARPNLPLFALQ